MDLCSNEHLINLLPYDGVVYYYGKVVKQKEATDYYDCLFNTINWKNDEAVIFGKHFITKRKAAWYGNSDYLYTYSTITKKAMGWTKELLAIKQLAEELTNASFNSCLLNLYHNGTEGMTWHSDNEKALKRNAPIASLSFGAERKFSFKHKKTKEIISVILENGSLLVMKDSTQTNWLHKLPPATKINKPRINLTFRTMVI